jgi:hypothetical protein
MFDRSSCADTRSAISSPASADGPERFASPAGPMIAASGLAAALASLSATQARALGLQISGIFGLRGCTSSRSAALQSSLASKLRQRLPCAGGILFRQIWKDRSTPAQQQIYALRASVHRISGSASTGLQPASARPTPAARDWKGAPLDRWGTNARPLNEVAVLAGWPTPMAGTPAQNGNNAAGNNDSSRRTVALLSGWATPAAQEPGGSPEQFLARKAKHSCGQSVTALSMQVQLIEAARYTDSGELLTGSAAAMASGGQLNPAHSRWLMGYPPEWDDCAVTAMPSSRRSRRNS